MSQKQGLIDQLRSQHWAVKIVLVLVLSVVLSPFLAIGAFIVGSVLGEAGVGLLTLAGLGLAGWFVFTSPAKPLPEGTPNDDDTSPQSKELPRPSHPVRLVAPAPASGAPWRYCESCGESFARSILHCPSCSAEWNSPVFTNPVSEIARYLNLIVRDFEDGLLDRGSYVRMRAEYERRLEVVRPEPEPVAIPEPLPPVFVPAAVSEPVAPGFAQPAVPVSIPLEIPVAAIIVEPFEVPVAAIESAPVAAATVVPEVPVRQAPPPRPAAAIPEGPSGPTIGDMGRAVLGWAAERQADILLYVGAFMLSVAAIIFVAYQGEALSGGIRFTILTAYAVGFLSLGLLLHRWERVKEAAPAFLALGAILIPLDFLALRTQVLGQEQVSNEMLWLLGSASCSALYFSLAIRGYGRFYYVPAVPSALVAWGSLGAVLNLPDAWFGPWYLLLAAPAYVGGVANIERQKLARWAIIASILIAVPSVASTHLLAGITGDNRFAIPTAYAMVLAAGAVGLRWRRETVVLALLPPLAALAGGSFAWAAFDVAPEWFVPFIAGAGLGYLVVAHFEVEERARAWAFAALVSAGVALTLAHALAPMDAARGILPVTYAIAFVGVSGAYGRWRWGEAAALMPPLAAMLVLTTAWASTGVGIEWYGAFAGIAPLGYLALAFFDKPERRPSWQWSASACALLGPAMTHVAIATDVSAEHWALAAAYAPVLLGAAVASGAWRLAWRPAPGAIPGLAAMTALSVAWAQWDMTREWFPAFAAAASLGYIALAWLDRPNFDRMWAGISGIAAVAAIVGAHVAVLDIESSRWVLPAAYAIVFASASAAFAKWRFEWSPPAGVVPPLAAMTALSVAWAQWDIEPEWYPTFGAAVALGYIALAWFEDSKRQRTWAGFALAFGALAIAGAHLAVLPIEASRWALFPVYGQCLAGAAIVFAHGRFAWRLAPALVPATAAMTALTFAWAQWDLAPEWYPSFALAAGLGYLVLARLDLASFARSWGTIAGIIAVGAIAGVHLAVPLEGAEPAALPVAYAIALVGVAASFWKWRWIESGAVLPPVVAMTAATAGWAWFGLAPEWYGCFAAATAFGYLALARFDLQSRREYWWSGAVIGPIVGLGLAHPAVALDSEAAKVALPAVYAIGLAAAAAAFLIWRFAWRVAPATIPALASAATLAFSWAQWDVSLWWWGAFIVPAAYGYIALALADEKPMFRSWLSGAAAASVLGVALAQFLQADIDAPPRALPLAYGEALVATAFIVAWWRFANREAIAVLPPLAAAFGASLGWAEFDMRLEWLTAWIAAASAGYFIPAYFELAYRDRWRATSVVFAASALVGAHALAFEPDPVRWQLPVSYGVILLVWAWHSVTLRDETSIGPPILASVLGAALFWATGVPPEWWAYPALAIAAAMMAGEPLLRTVRPLHRIIWAYAVAIGFVSTIAVLSVNYSHPEHGFATQLITAALLFVAAARSACSIVRLFWPEPTPAMLRAERTVLIQAGFAFLFGAAASFNGILGIEATDRAWALAAVATVPWLFLALPILRRDALWTFAPIGLSGMTIATFLGIGSDGTLTGVLATAAVGPVIACFGVRRWAFLGVANSFFLLALWAGWRWLEVDIAYLPLGFAAIAVAEWAVLTRLRKYSPAPGESDLVIAYLSWGPWLISGLVAGMLLSRKQQAIDSGTSLVTTSEWALAAAVLAMAAAAVTAEGLRLWKRWAWIVGGAGLLIALLMGIASYEPTNVQAYTAPIGAYLIVIGLTFRSSPQVLKHHLLVHEAVMLAGALFLVLPPAEQSFQPGGGKFGLELIGVALAMLIVGLLLHGRWLVAAGVTTMTVTAMRMVTGGLFSTPYWLLLGLGGTALIAFGFLVLLERERWDRFRHRVVRWWQETAAKGPPTDGTAAPEAG